MPARTFTFTLDCSTRSASPEMLRDLSLQVMGYVGCGDQTVEATAAALATAVADAAGSGVQALGVTFRSDAGTLEIVLLCGEHEMWRVSRTIP